MNLPPSQCGLGFFSPCIKYHAAYTAQTPRSTSHLALSFASNDAVFKNKTIWRLESAKTRLFRNQILRTPGHSKLSYSIMPGPLSAQRPSQILNTGIKAIAMPSALSPKVNVGLMLLLTLISARISEVARK